jgi:hypothetical protein
MIISSESRCYSSADGAGILALQPIVDAYEAEVMLTFQCLAFLDNFMAYCTV